MYLRRACKTSFTNNLLAFLILISNVSIDGYMYSGMIMLTIFMFYDTGSWSHVSLEY